MTTIRVFEPALCCNTGVCGPDPETELVRFTADLAYLRERGVDIQRHNLANDPQKFATNDTVREFLKVAGSKGLPLILVDGVTVLTGSYPSRERLLELAGVSSDLGLTAADAAGGCCGGAAPQQDTQCCSDASPQQETECCSDASAAKDDACCSSQSGPAQPCC